MADPEENKPENSGKEEATKTTSEATPKKKAPVKKKAAAKKKSATKKAATQSRQEDSAETAAANDAEKAKQEAVQQKMKDMGIMQDDKQSSAPKKPASKSKGSGLLVWASLAIAAAIGLYLLLSGNGTSLEGDEQAEQVAGIASSNQGGTPDDSFLPPWASHTGRYRIPSTPSTEQAVVPKGSELESTASQSRPPVQSSRMPPGYGQPPEAPAWVRQRPQPPQAPAWVRQRPQPPQAPAWIRQRPQPPEAPAWVRQRPQPPQAPAWVRQRPQPPEAPAWAGQRPQPPEAPAWVQEWPTDEGARGPSPGAPNWPEPTEYRAPPPPPYYYAPPY